MCTIFFCDLRCFFVSNHATRGVTAVWRFRDSMVSRVNPHKSEHRVPPGVCFCVLEELLFGPNPRVLLLMVCFDVAGA